MYNFPLAGIDAAILVGGLGTRLREVISDVPKPLAPVLGRPFLFYLLDLLALRGARSVTLCCGYKAEAVQILVGSQWLGMPVYYSLERELLGTAGALRFARQTLLSERILVLNGDSFILPDFIRFRQKAERSEACLAVVKVPDAGRFGAVQCDAAFIIQAFREKEESGKPGLINAGMYFLSQSVIDSIPAGSVSLEKQVFPALIQAGQVTGYDADSTFLDIGIPESYAESAQFMRQLGMAPHSMFPDGNSMEGASVKFGVCVLIFDEAGRVLLEKRADCGWWCVPGGKLDTGETVMECAIREIHEETGLKIEITGFLGVFSDPRRRTIRYPDNGDLRHLVDVAVIGRRLAGELRISHESTALKWFAFSQLPVDTVPPVIEMLRCASERSEKSIIR